MSMMSSQLAQILGALPWFAWIAIVAIVFGCLTGLIQGARTHRERLEMIRQGMHPDADPNIGKPKVPLSDEV
ncbi:hypothetical protein BH23PLA1_BH23PLA1_09420 [soil metagenome]